VSAAREQQAPSLDGSKPARKRAEAARRPKRVSVLTHRRPSQTHQALTQLIAEAARLGVTLCFDEDETAKHDLSPHELLSLNDPASQEVDLCVVLGGDGTILRALRRFTATKVPVFAVNYGEIGFLATIEPSELEQGLKRALAGDFELLRLPAIVLDTPSGPEIAINDVAIHRKVGERVAEVAYAIDGEIVGNVRCDGLVIATPAGSTGYNLANGGPVMAWGVEGFVVSFIAPHSLTARALVVAPSDLLTVHNRSRETLDVAVDGRPVCEIAAGQSLDTHFMDGGGTIAQLPGSSFYRRLREKFGKLAA
jgi:NAD+ kinase